VSGDGPHQFSLAYLTVFGSPPRRMIQVAAETGYDFVSLRLAPVTADEPTFPYTTDQSLVADTVNALDEYGVSVLDIELIRTDPGTKSADWRRFVEVGEELGARHIITQVPEPDAGRAVEIFQEICDLGSQSGMTIDLEFIPWTATHDLARTVEIVTLAGHPIEQSWSTPFILHVPNRRSRSSRISLTTSSTSSNFVTQVTRGLSVTTSS